MSAPYISQPQLQQLYLKPTQALAWASSGAYIA